MKKKYIFVLTFLCVLFVQLSYGQANLSEGGRNDGYNYGNAYISFFEDLYDSSISSITVDQNGNVVYITYSNGVVVNLLNEVIVRRRKKSSYTLESYDQSDMYNSTDSSDDCPSKDWCDCYELGCSYFGGGGGYGSETPPAPPTQLEIAQTIASNAITTGLAFKELYVDVGKAILDSKPINTNTLVKNIFDSNPFSTIVKDLSAPGAFKGIALINNVGKVFGVTGAISSFSTLVADYQADGKVDMVNVVDLGINVGSLAIKSNIVGLGISAGWLLIKGELESSN